MNNSYHDKANNINYIIPASRQLSPREIELAIDLSLETYADSALSQHLARHPTTKDEELEDLKRKFREERVAKLSGCCVLISACSKKAPKKKSRNGLTKRPSQRAKAR